MCKWAQECKLLLIYELPLSTSVPLRPLELMLPTCVLLLESALLKISVYALRRENCVLASKSLSRTARVRTQLTRSLFFFLSASLAVFEPRTLMSFILTSITKEEAQHSVQYCWEALTCHAAYLSSLSSSFYPMHFVPNSRWEWKCLVLYFLSHFLLLSWRQKMPDSQFLLSLFFWRARKRWKLLSSSFLLTQLDGSRTIDAPTWAHSRHN